MVFGKGSHTVKELGVLVNKLPTNFKKAPKPDEHFHGKLFHKSAMEPAIVFLKMQKNKAFSINQQLCSLRRK